VTPAMIPPPIFLWRLTADLILCFSCFSTTSFHECPGDPLYSCFRSILREPRENGWHRRLKAQTRHGGAVWLADCANWSHLRPVDLRLAHFIPYCLSRNFQAVLPDLALFRVP
jgi:hypothetical protein